MKSNYHENNENCNIQTRGIPIQEKHADVSPESESHVSVLFTILYKYGHHWKSVKSIENQRTSMNLYKKNENQ